MMMPHPIAAILREDWDPIGIADEPMAQDASHDHASPIEVLIADDTVPYDLAGLLRSFERDVTG